MLCPSGHAIDTTGKKLRLFSSYTCDRCRAKVADNGGLYHKCSRRCDFRLCEHCYQRATRSHYVLEPCTDAFPTGLGPFSIHRTGMQPGDLKPFDLQKQRQVNARIGGPWVLSASFFSRNSKLRLVWEALVSNHVAVDCPAGLFPEGRRDSKCLAVQLSPAARVNLPEHLRKALSMPEGGGVSIAWMHPLLLEWQMLLDEVRADEATDSAAEWSLLTVGGFVFIRNRVDNGTKVAEVLCANSIAYSPRGAMSFSSAQPWKPSWTAELKKAGRFQKVTAQKWAAAGAQYMCWVGPEEKLLDPHAHHGGVAFLFHGLDEPDEQGRDRLFEVVAARGGCEGRGPAGASTALPPKLLMSAFAFSLASDPTFSSPVHQQRTRRRFLQAAGEGRWALVGHLLGEWPHLAVEADEAGQTALHKCATLRVPGGRKTSELLGLLHRGGASIEAQDSHGRTPYDLGDQTFKALVCQIWGLIPDLFADPEIWFDYWDKDRNGILWPGELIPALAAAYRVGDLGRQWIETYVHTHYRELAPGSALTKKALLGDKGMLHLLQSSEEFISLRAQDDDGAAKMPAIFRTEGRKQANTFDKEALQAFGEALEAVRKQHGWAPGRPAPNSARRLEVPAPFAGGESDPAARLVAAREMLAWTFTKTTALTGQEWLQGFKVSFKGGDDVGIDEGGLTKAWVQEIAYALWGDEAFLDTKSTGSFFKPDYVTDVMLHCFHVRTESFYKWVGHFLAYAVYQNCVFDCRLCPWALRWLVRVVEARTKVPPMVLALAGNWQQPGGGSCIATVCGDTLFQHTEKLDHAAEVRLSVQDGKVAAHFEGSPITAAITDGGKLLWSNGDVWVRSRESEATEVFVMPSWPDTPEGNSQLLEDLATMDAQFANSLWRVHYEMPPEDLQWLTFAYGGAELEPGGEDLMVNESNKGRYMRLCCQAALVQQATRGLQAFSDGFFDVLPQELVVGMPADCFQWLLVGDDEISQEQLDALERLLVPDGLVPRHLCDNPAVRQCAAWVFRTARAGDGRFRSRLFEFWTGTPRLPQGGVQAISPKPRLQVMVQASRPPAPPMWEIELQEGWFSYDLATAAELTRAQSSGHSRVELQVRDNKYVVDFIVMQQVNQRTGARRNVRRRDPSPPEEGEDMARGVRRIETWPATRFPEGHTCGNELWVPLCDSEAELARLLHTAVMNFEAGFALA